MTGWDGWAGRRTDGWMTGEEGRAPGARFQRAERGDGRGEKLLSRVVGPAGRVRTCRRSGGAAGICRMPGISTRRAANELQKLKATCSQLYPPPNTSVRVALHHRRMTSIMCAEMKATKPSQSSKLKKRKERKKVHSCWRTWRRGSDRRSKRAAALL